MLKYWHCMRCFWHGLVDTGRRTLEDHHQYADECAPAELRSEETTPGLDLSLQRTGLGGAAVGE